MSTATPPHRDPAVVQSVGPPGWVDLGPGYLAPELLPVDLLRAAYSAALAEYGSAALHYGANQGVARLRAALAERTGREDGTPADPDGVVVTAGTSASLHLLAGQLGDRGDTVLVEETGYDLGHRILTDRGLRLVPIPGDRCGPDPARMTDAVSAVRRDGGRVAFGYLVPTFHNPTGRLVGVARRRALVGTARALGVPLVEDDAYRELPLDGAPVPPSLAALSDRAGIWRLGTFAKTLAPGLRLGWIDTDPAAARDLAGSGLLDSGGGLNHLASLAVLTLVESGDYDRHLHGLRTQLRRRRDALVAGLAALSSHVRVTVPAGGFFCWVEGTDDLPVADPVDAAGRAGVRVAPGDRFGDRAGRAVRLSFSQHGPAELAEGARRLVAAWLPRSRPWDATSRRCDPRSTIP